MIDLVSIDKLEDKEREVPPTPGALYYEAEYVIRTWLEHRLHHTYPESGGYNDQCEFLMRDWHAMNVYYSRVYAGHHGESLVPDNAVPLKSIMRD